MTRSLLDMSDIASTLTRIVASELSQHMDYNRRDVRSW
jgi:hypothetical protein